MSGECSWARRRRNDAMVAAGIRARSAVPYAPAYGTLVNDVFTAATLTKPQDDFGHRGGKSGKRHFGTSGAIC